MSVTIDELRTRRLRSALESLTGIIYQRARITEFNKNMEFSPLTTERGSGKDRHVGLPNAYSKPQRSVAFRLPPGQSFPTTSHRAQATDNLYNLEMGSDLSNWPLDFYLSR